MMYFVSLKNEVKIMQITAILTPDGTAKATTGTSQIESTGDFSNYMDESTSNNSLTSLFQKASDTYGVSVSLLTAMAKQESSFQADATSSSGAMGIMQLMPATATELGCSDAYDPEQNIMAGAKYISQLLQKYDGNVSLALAAYNAGSNNVDKYGGIPPFEETQNYVAKITGYMNEGVTLPDGTTTAATSDTSNATAITSSFLNNLDQDSLKELLNKIFSYDDYLGLINQLVTIIQDAAVGTTGSTSSTATANSTANTTGTANTATTNSDTTAAVGNSTLSVKVTASNPTTETTSEGGASTTDPDLYYASKSINYNNSVLNLLAQNSKE